MLVVALSHFLDLKTELELLGFGHNVDLIEDEADSLASNVPSLIAYGPPDGVGE
jgi:hypothetical protein